MAAYLWIFIAIVAFAAGLGMYLTTGYAVGLWMAAAGGFSSAYQAWKAMRDPVRKRGRPS